WLNYGLSLYGMYSNNDRRYSRIWNRVRCMAPLGDVYDEDGNLVDYPLGDGNMNPLADNNSDSYINNYKTLSFTPQAYVEIKPVKGLSIKSVIGGYLRNVKASSYLGNHSYQGLESGKISAEIGNRFTYNYKWQNIVTYDFNLHNDHRFTATGVTEWSKDRLETSTAIANGFDSDDYGYHNLGASTGTPTVASSYIQTQKMSYAIRLNYAYKGRYLASFTTRWDGASILSSGHKWDTFPAGSLAWRISDEPFMSDIRWLNNLKIRAEYGVTGNAGASAYATLDYSRTGIIGFQDIPQNYSGYNLSIANKDLGWEKSYNLNIGLDAGFLNDRITFTADWYRTD
ncbi:MAG: TonB-dependent receptor, partial [Duncaniella sp.]|nr:TonB-dependent receptor [Duncaniella sp.]